MTAGSSSVNSNLIRTMSKSHASASRHSTGNIEPVQVATFVYRWPPSMVREALSNFGVVKKIGSVPARRYAVLRADCLEYFHDASHADAMHPPAKFWSFHPLCTVSSVFPYKYESQRYWNVPVIGSKETYCIYCFKIEWPNVNVARSNISSSEIEGDGKVVLQIGFSSEEEASEWHKLIKANITSMSPRAPATQHHSSHNVLKPTPRTSSSSDGDAYGAGTWYAIKHVKGVRVFMEGGSSGHQEEKARMISCIVKGDPESAFRSAWEFENFPSKVTKLTSFLKVVKEVDDHRRVLHIQYPYRGSYMFQHIIPTRIALLDVTWRQDDDGTFVMLFSNHPQYYKYARKYKSVPARMNAAITIAPLKPHYRLKGNYSHECLMTFVMRFEPGGWFDSESLSRLFFQTDAFFLQSMVDWFISVRERAEQDRFVIKPLKLGSALTEDTGAAFQVEQVVKKAASTAIEVLWRPSSKAEKEPFAAESTGMDSNLDPKYWSSGSVQGLKVRGKTYLDDRVKVPASASKFKIHRVDLFEFPAPCEHVAQSMDYVQSMPDEFFYIVQLMVPGAPHYSIVAAFTPIDKECLVDGSPFSILMQKFLNGSNQDRNELFKLIPSIVEGSWIVQKAVGSTPAILGKKIRIAYHRGPNYIELDFDIASSAMAANIVKLVSSATKTVVVDMAFLNEGHSEEELPEQLIGVLRLKKVDLTLAKRVHIKSE